MTRRRCLFRRSFPRCFTLGVKCSFEFFRAVRARPTLPPGSSTVPELPRRLLTRPRTAASSWARSARATPRASPPAPRWSPRPDVAPDKPTPPAPAATMARLRALDPMGTDDSFRSFPRGATGLFSRLTDPGDFSRPQAIGAVCRSFAIELHESSPAPLGPLTETGWTRPGGGLPTSGNLLPATGRSVLFGRVHESGSDDYCDPAEYSFCMRSFFF
jgi:hypothetical protein